MFSMPRARYEGANYVRPRCDYRELSTVIWAKYDSETPIYGLALDGLQLNLKVYCDAHHIIGLLGMLNGSKTVPLKPHRRSPRRLHPILDLPSSVILESSIPL